MKNSFVLVVLFFLLPLGVVGQYVAEDREEEDFRKWYIKPAAGITMPVTRLLSGDVTDNLVAYDDNSVYWQVFSGNLFFNQQWGVEITAQTGVSQRFLNRDKRFVSELETTYGSNYFVRATSEAEDDRLNPAGDNIDRILVGLVHRIYTRKLLLMPKLLFGVTPFYTNSGEAYLKEKNTNQLLHLTYQTSSPTSENFTIAPALTVGYRIGKRTLVNFDAMFSFFSANFTYTESLRNTFSKRTQTRIVPYDKQVGAFSLGVGLIIEL